MSKEKILDSIASAADHLEKSMQALAQEHGEKDIANSVWLASAEIEYASFLLSLMHQDEPDGSTSKRSSKRKQQMEVAPTLESAKGFLKRAKGSLEAGNSTQAHESVWAARDLVRRLQNFFDKKRKNELKKRKA